MAINNINANTGATTADGQVQAKSGTQGLGREDFMKLLVAQLKNQDPDNPLDTKELVTQLSQLTSVEQLVTMSEKLQNLESATNRMAANQSSSLIGKVVEAKNDSMKLDSTGPASTAVNFGQGADQVVVKVSNEAGRVVRTFELSNMTPGQHDIVWDGNTDSNERASAGRYSVEVAAKDKSGNPVQADLTVSGVVSGVSYENGYPEVQVGTTSVPLSNVTSIRQ